MSKRILKIGRGVSIFIVIFILPWMAFSCIYHFTDYYMNPDAPVNMTKEQSDTFLGFWTGLFADIVVLFSLRFLSWIIFGDWYRVTSTIRIFLSFPEEWKYF